MSDATLRPLVRFWKLVNRPINVSPQFQWLALTAIWAANFAFLIVYSGWPVILSFGFGLLTFIQFVYLGKKHIKPDPDHFPYFAGNPTSNTTGSDPYER